MCYAHTVYDSFLYLNLKKKKICSKHSSQHIKLSGPMIWYLVKQDFGYATRDCGILAFKSEKQCHNMLLIRPTHTCSIPSN